jgi:hypothetical protein
VEEEEEEEEEEDASRAEGGIAEARGATRAVATSAARRARDRT